MDEKTQKVMEALRRERRLRRWGWTVAAVAVVAVWAVPVFSQTMVPYVFSPNTPARASEINSNFEALADAIDAHEARFDVLEARDDFVPAGTIAFFATSACPTGWSTYADAAGRYVVATSGGSIAATAGAPLGDLEARAHDHSIQHRHPWSRYIRDGSPRSRVWYSFDSATAGDAEIIVRDFDSGVDSGNNYYPFEGSSSKTWYTGDPQGVPVAADGSPRSGDALGSEIAPYIQLLACQKG